MGDLLSIIQRGLSLDAQLWRDLVTDGELPQYRLAFVIIVLAGFSEGIAQSVVLFLNQIKARRFIFSLVINALIFTFGFLFYVVSIDAIAVYIFDARTPIMLLYGLALSYAPLLFNFMIMIPYFGQGLQVYLQVYHFLALTIATSILYALSYQQAVLCVIASTLLLYLLRISIGRPLAYLVNSSKNLVAGTELREFEDLRQELPSALRDNESQRGMME